MKLIITSLFFLFCIGLSAQNFGYYGKKNIFDLQIGCYTPLIQTWDNGSSNFYKASNEQLHKTKDRIELAYSLSYFRSLNDKVSFGIEFAYQSLDTYTPDYLYRNVYDANGYTDIENMEGEIERFRFSHFSVVPKFEFSKKDGIFGMGIKHQLGFGFGRTTFLQKDYVFDLAYSDQYGSYEASLTPEQKEAFKDNMYNFSNNKFKNLIFFYALNFRKPLSKNLFLNYGFRYTLNFSNDAINYPSNESTYWVKSSYIKDLVREDRLNNLVTFRLGASYAF